MKIYLKYIFLFLIAGSIFSSCNQKDEKVYSFWALQNRATGMMRQVQPVATKDLRIRNTWTK